MLGSAETVSCKPGKLDVAGDDLECITLLPLPPECWIHRYDPHAWFMQSWDGAQGSVHAWQVLYQ